jgi:hypothetical protein
MSLDLAKTHRLVAEEFQAARPIGKSMVRIIKKCAAITPHPDWDRLRELDFDDLGPLLEWIKKPLVREPPDSPLKGLWFGIFNPIYGNFPTADFYISGCSRFDPDPTSYAWTGSRVWWPESRCAHSKVMSAIYRIAYKKGGLKIDAEYPLCLAYPALAIRELLNTLDARLVLKALKAAGPVGVAAGFDSGDFLLLGKYTRDGLTSL